MEKKERKKKASHIPELVSALLSEYTAMRDHMTNYQNERNSYINYTLLLIAGCVSAFGTNLYDKAPIALLILPFLFFSIAMMYLDRSIRINRSAAYLHFHIRPKLLEILDEDIFHYELFKSNSNRKFRFVKLFIDQYRFAIFLIPIITCVASYMYLDNYLDSAIEIFLLLLNTIFCIAIIVFSVFIEETTGFDHKDEN